MKRTNAILVLLLLAGVLAGCGKGTASAASTSGQSPAAATPEPYTSAVLVTTYPDALPASSQLALGTLKLEGTPNAVTPDQARVLLPLWQAIQGGAARTDAEVNAVLKQIEKAMGADQLRAIAAMQLTAQDMADYAQANGLTMGLPGTPWPAGQDRQGTPPAGGQRPQGFGNLTDAERQAFRATAKAGGFGGPGGLGGGPQGQNLSEEQRAALRATAEAGGLPFGGRSSGGGWGFLASLARPLVELLAQRAAQ